MALKSPLNKFKSPNKSDEKDPNDNHREGTSQNSQEFRRRTRSLKKRNSKRSLNYFPSNADSRSLSRGRTVGSRPVTPMARPVLQAPTMNIYYRGQKYRCPVNMPNWNMAARLRYQNPMYRFPFQPVTVPIYNSQMFPPVCPYPGGYTYPPPSIAPMVPPTVLIDEFPTVPNYYRNIYSPEQVVPNEICDPYCSEIESVDQPPFYEINTLQPPSNRLEFYLSLPRNLFPNAKMLSIDPNPIIDSFCKYNDVIDHASWIMDLEFGVPREATTRPIAMYNVKYNSVHCKNTPNAIHPGYERCNPEFRSVLAYYYDCVYSTWYRGYNILNQDRSVENFQSWLCPAMQELGMCWP